MVFELDEKGHLKDHQHWNQDCAIWFAEQEQLSLTLDHWTVIHFYREFYLEYRLTPPMRVIIKYLGTKWGPEKANSAYLTHLFPRSVMRQASRLAGLPKPKRCL